jgi:hypothetical protein
MNLKFQKIIFSVVLFHNNQIFNFLSIIIINLLKIFLKLLNLLKKKIIFDILKFIGEQKIKIFLN